MPTERRGPARRAEGDGHVAAEGERQGLGPVPVPRSFAPQGGRRVSGRVLLRDARLYDPASGLDRTADLLLEDGAIAAIGHGLPAHGARLLEGGGRLALPGFIDLHVHLREPGETHKEGIETGALAAARGGFTAVVAMANTRPAVDTPDAIQRALACADAARGRGGARVWPAACLTRGLEGERPTDASALAAAGAVALSDDGRSPARADVVLEAMRGAAAAGLPVLDHAEDETLSRGVAHDGPAGRALGLAPRLAAAESARAARDIALAQAAGARLHLQHLSSRATVPLIAEARRRDLPVSAEATPHHLLLTESVLEEAGTAARVNPPLREEADRAALWQALVDGTIEAVATDHAPHTEADKAVDFASAAPGISGLDGAVALLYQEVRAGRLTLSAFVARFAYGPARILGRPPERLAEGAPCAVTLFDPEEAWTLGPESMASRGKSTPFRGRRLVGRPAGILLGEKEDRAC
jgi:dihydroorotase